LWDTAGQEDYDRLRPLSYPGTDVFLILYSIISRNSFLNVKSKWIPEIKYHAPGVPIIIVGNKLDLSDEERKDVDVVTMDQGNEMARECEVLHMQCSALTGENVMEVFESAIDVAMAAISATTSRKRGFSLSGWSLFNKSGNSATKSTGPPPRPKLPIMPAAGKAPWIYPDNNLIGEDWAMMLQNEEAALIADVQFKLNSNDSVHLAHSSILCSVSRVFRGILNIAVDLPQVDISHQSAGGLGYITPEDIHEKKYFPIDQVYKEGEKTIFRINEEISEAVFVALLRFIYSGQCEIADDTDKLSLIRCSAGLCLPELERFATNHNSDDDFLNPSITTWLNDINAYTALDIFYSRNLGTCKVKLKIGTDCFRDTEVILWRHLEDSAILTDLIFEFLQQSEIELNPHFIVTRCPVLYKYISKGVPLELGKAQAPFPENSYEAVLGVLEYLHSGHIDIDDYMVKPLLVLSHRMELKRLGSLTELCISKYIERKVTNRIADADVNLVELLLVCHKLGMAQAVNFLKHFIATNYEPMSKTPEFKLLKGSLRRWIDNHQWPPQQYYKDVERYKKESAQWDEKYGDKENNSEAAQDAKLFGEEASVNDNASNCLVM